MAQQLKFIIYFRKGSPDLGFRNPWVERNVDEFEIRTDIKYLHLIRYGGEDNMYNLDDIISYSYDEEKKE